MHRGPELMGDVDLVLPVYLHILPSLTPFGSPARDEECPLRRLKFPVGRPAASRVKRPETEAEADDDQEVHTGDGDSFRLAIRWRG